jgi:UDP-N-acetylmuramoyl-tripeptide--D-alanyl-D-alanine ligase
MLFPLALKLLGPFSHHFSGTMTGVSVDSRETRPGDLFFALPGNVTDGHVFLDEVARKGAFGAVISKDYQGPLPPFLPVSRVDDPLQMLQELARLLVREVGAKVIAVTGSIGKTTTKEFIRTILSVGTSVAGTNANNNSQIGLPLSLINSIRGGEQWLVVEMGMTNAGHIRRLIQIAPPDIAIVTMVALVHVENFEDLSQIAKAKAEIFEHSRTTWNLYNADTPHADVLASIGYGKKRSFSTKNDPQAYWSLAIGDGTVTIREGSVQTTLPCPMFPARHVYDNMLAAIATVRTVGLGWDAIEEALPLLTLPKMRLEKKRCQGIWFINDAYNACELSMISALDVLSDHAPARRVAVLGQMRELKTFSEECHRRIGEKALGTADVLYCLGKECEPIVKKWKEAGRSCFWTLSLDELKAQLKEDLEAGDVVLLKGSRANELWKVLDCFAEGSHR